jgi:hypothetical protein
VRVRVRVRVRAAHHPSVSFVCVHVHVPQGPLGVPVQASYGSSTKPGSEGLAVVEMASASGTCAFALSLSWPPCASVRFYTTQAEHAFAHSLVSIV